MTSGFPSWFRSTISALGLTTLPHGSIYRLLRFSSPADIYKASSSPAGRVSVLLIVVAALAVPIAIDAKRAITPTTLSLIVCMEYMRCSAVTANVKARGGGPAPAALRPSGQAAPRPKGSLSMWLLENGYAAYDDNSAEK